LTVSTERRSDMLVHRETDVGIATWSKAKVEETRRELQLLLALALKPTV
jgi:hypothetical protein